MSKAYLFYGTQLVEEFLASDPRPNNGIKSVYGQEIYDGGYMYYPNAKTEWWRCDLTPVLLADVPKELRAFALLLT
jgi:hypothetical protein